MGLGPCITHWRQVMTLLAMGHTSPAPDKILGSSLSPACDSHRRMPSVGTGVKGRARADGEQVCAGKDP